MSYDSKYDFSLDDLSKNDLEDLMVECAVDSRMFAKLIFPEHFYKPFASAHDEIFHLLDTDKSPYKVVAAPRGVGKSMIASLICRKNILYGRKHFIGYLSDSLDKAEMETEFIKSSLSTNEWIKKLFPPIKPKYYGDSDERYGKKSWVAYDNTFVIPRGSGQQVNGLRWRHHRPDFWCIDDFEDVTEVLSEIQRKKKREWFYSALLNTVSRYDKDYEFFYIDTIKHSDALIVELLESSDWTSLQLSVCDENYQTLMPDFLPQSELDEEVRKHQEKKIMDLFAMNFQSLPVSKEDQSFNDLIQYYDETDPALQERWPKCINIVIVDPAKTAKTHNAQSGFVVWSIDLERSAYYVRQAFGEFLHPDEICSTALRLADQFNADAIGLEVTGLEEWGSYILKNLNISRGGKTYHLEELKARGGRGEIGGHDGSKIGRVNFGLLPLCRQGLVYLNRVGTGALVAQMLSFPRPARWDVIDAAAYLPQMLERALMYVDPQLLEEDQEGGHIEAEYAGLYDEPAFKWQRA